MILRNIRRLKHVCFLVFCDKMIFKISMWYQTKSAYAMFKRKACSQVWCHVTQWPPKRNLTKQKQSAHLICRSARCIPQETIHQPTPPQNGRRKIPPSGGEILAAIIMYNFKPMRLDIEHIWITWGKKNIQPRIPWKKAKHLTNYVYIYNIHICTPTMWLLTIP